ncbi:carbohydrate ABC transporter permease [Salinibacterium sp. UTAS2018]|uniref:carbohydrate ABC transporter permease n=1 Tax=Salinibacterium sp. UTAS2018 TaxID=2508880 RepID=UPI0010096CAD|nr:carbohydrate ABC transporter permease [Salinibacterium sp. UTAS2018]QAV70947.1 carbohydrate ABC transporter permease [Salinibacterium sp. UTAS2018]
MSDAQTAGTKRNLGVEITLGFVLVLSIIPIAFTTLLAFLPNRAIVSSSWDFPFWLGNFERVFKDGIFIAQIGNSLLIVLGTVAICLVIGTLSGYSLSRLHPPRWITIPALVIAGFIPLIPPMTLLPGLYVLLSDLGLIGGVGGLVLVNAFLNLPFAVLLMSSYFSTIPEELREAGIMDGASELTVLLRIMLPVVRPGIAAVGVFTAIMAWNEFQMGLTLTSGGATAPVTVGIAGLLQPFAVTWGELAAAGTLAAIPIIVMSIFANRQIVAGLTAGAIKG